MAVRSRGPFMVGLDVGTTGAKAGIIDPTGSVIATASVTYETSTPRPGWAEQNPADWWEAACGAVRQALSLAELDGGEIAGVGLSGQMHGSVFLDERGSVIRPCILWCDQRTSRQCAQINAEVGAENLASWVGNPALAGFTAPKVLWLRENEPSSYARVRRLLLPKDYVNLLLTGSAATEVSDASGTLLFDVTRRQWSRPMLEKLGIPPEWLPEVLESSDLVGTVSSAAADRTGLKAGTPVAAGGADNACGALGMGVLAGGRAAVSVGSSGTVLAPVDSPRVDPHMRLHTFCHAVTGTWYLMGVMLSAGLALRWFADELGEPEKGAAVRGNADVYDLLLETAAGAPAGSEGLLFLPYLTGERTPHADPDARGVLFGLDLTKTRAHVIRSVIEGVTFGLKDSIMLMRELEVPLSSVVSGGGGSRSRFWRQMQSDAFELPLVAAGTSDSAMLGAALLGAVAGGVFSTVAEACGAAVSYGERHEPDPESFRAYRSAYSRFRAVYPALKELF